jgi:2,5-diamino-6-(ribosylamino)-4(3H)-pyrimidinone 5'-phosphate reductase
VQSRPRVLVNMAMTADGKIDTVERRGARISGPADTARVDRLRAETDAILVGGHTLLGEDPRLTVRDQTLCASRIQDGRPRQPAKVAVVSCLGTTGGPGSLPSPSRFLEEGGGDVIVCTTRRTSADTVAWLEDQGARVVVHDGPRVDLDDALAFLGQAGFERLLVEGGSTIMAALLEAQLVDELRFTVAPLIFGGESAPTPVGGPGWPAEDAIRLELADASRDEDGDMVLRYLVRGHTAA